MLGLVLLGLAIADALGVPITPLIYAASALLVVGLTLVAATWLGRARGILPVGLLLLVAVLGLSVAVPASQFVHQVGYTSVAQLPAQPVTVDRGVLKVDLSRLDVTKDATFAADLGTGAVEIIAPPNTNLVLDYSVAQRGGAGQRPDPRQRGEPERDVAARPFGGLRAHPDPRHRGRPGRRGGEAMKRRDTVALIFGLLLTGVALGSLWFAITGTLDWDVLKLAMPIGLVVVGIAGLAVSRTGD